ncbi:MAG: hypothetical protein Q7T79_00110 [bacterium]|nr:hypothetical protein [bacterium]
MFKKSIKSLLIVCLLILIVVFVAILFRNKANVTQAENVDETLTGWAWSGNIGWISFSSTTPFNYGVKIDNTTGNFSGYAWNEMYGWIYFGPDATLLVGPDKTLLANSSINSGSAPSDPKIWAKADLVTGVVTGWAKILSAKDGGWIKMSDDSVVSWKDKGVKVDLSTGDLSGWAWNGDATNVGWISFNSINEPTSPTAYKVNYPISSSFINAPTNIKVANLPGACCGAIVEWKDNSDNETGFEVEMSTDKNNWIPFCEKKLPKNETTITKEVVSCRGDKLSPGVNYYFRVKAVIEENKKIIKESVWLLGDVNKPYKPGYCAPVASISLPTDCNGVTINWKQTGVGVVSYDILRSETGQAESFLSVISKPIEYINGQDDYTYFDDKNINKGKTYYYKVIAQTDNLESNVVPILPCASLKNMKWKEVKPR